MAKDSGSSILILGALGVAVYGYYQGWFSSLLGSPAVGTSPAGSSSAGGATGTAPPAASPTAGTSSSSGTSATYSGPSLAQIFSNLSAAELAAVGADPALSCPGAPGAPVAAPVLRRSPGGGIATPPTTTKPTGVSGLGDACDPVATYDVHSWYLVYRANSGITTPPDAPDHTTQIPLSQYWAWAAPLLSQQIPGLSGYAKGIAGLGALVRAARGW